MNARRTLTAIENGKFNEIFTTLYGRGEHPRAESTLYKHRERVREAIRRRPRDIPFLGRWQKRDLRQPHRPQPRLACSPPRSTSTSSRFRRRPTTALCHVCVKSEGFSERPQVDGHRVHDRRTPNLYFKSSQSTTSQAWCSGFVKYGHKAGGFDALRHLQRPQEGLGALVLRRISRSWSGIIINGFYNEGKRGERRGRAASRSSPRTCSSASPAG